MESRMLGNLHVRFGEGDEETCPGNGARRFIPTLPATAAALSLFPTTTRGEAGFARGAESTHLFREDTGVASRNPQGPAKPLLSRLASRSRTV